MTGRRGRFIPILILSLARICHGEGGGREQAVPFYSWDTRGDAYPDLAGYSATAHLGGGAYPVAGIASHHLLAGELIDNWFRELAGARTVRRFFILSPRHWDLGTGDFSLSDGSWMTERGPVESDRDCVRRLAAGLDGEIDREVFAMEHGIDTFMPFISRHFPGAEVVPLVYRGESPVSLPVAEKLWDNLAPYFTGPAARANFLLVSSDFAHHGDLEGTVRKDTRTVRFMESPDRETWIYAGCDNRPGIYALAMLAESLTSPDMTILYHTNSFFLSGRDGDDITSYFFTYLSGVSDSALR